MLSRRKYLSILTASAVALVVVGGIALAEELTGAITKVDVDAKKITITAKDGKETVVVVTDKTEVVTKKGSIPLDLEKLEKRVKKAQDGGNKIAVKVEVEDGKASKITYVGAGKGARKKPAPPQD